MALEVLRTLDRAGSRVAAVVLTGSDNELDYAQVVKLGARGLVLRAMGRKNSCRHPYRGKRRACVL